MEVDLTRASIRLTLSQNFGLSGVVRMTSLAKRESIFADRYFSTWASGTSYRISISYLQNNPRHNPPIPVKQR